MKSDRKAIMELRDKLEALAGSMTGGANINGAPSVQLRLTNMVSQMSEQVNQLAEQLNEATGNIEMLLGAMADLERSVGKGRAAGPASSAIDVRQLALSQEQASTLVRIITDSLSQNVTANLDDKLNSLLKKQLDPELADIAAHVGRQMQEIEKQIDARVANRMQHYLPGMIRDETIRTVPAKLEALVQDKFETLFAASWVNMTPFFSRCVSAYLVMSANLLGDRSLSGVAEVVKTLSTPGVPPSDPLLAKIHARVTNEIATMLEAGFKHGNELVAAALVEHQAEKAQALASAADQLPKPSDKEHAHPVPVPSTETALGLAFDTALHKLAQTVSGTVSGKAPEAPPEPAKREPVVHRPPEHPLPAKREPVVHRPPEHPLPAKVVPTPPPVPAARLDPAQSEQPDIFEVPTFVTRLVHTDTALDGAVVKLYVGYNLVARRKKLDPGRTRSNWRVLDHSDTIESAKEKAKLLTDKGYDVVAVRCHNDGRWEVAYW